jgi:hypothetical protein
MVLVQNKVDSFQNPEGLHVYRRKQLIDRTCDPGGRGELILKIVQ